MGAGSRPGLRPSPIPASTPTAPTSPTSGCAALSRRRAIRREKKPGSSPEAPSCAAPPRRRAELDTFCHYGETLLVFDEADGFVWCQSQFDRYVGYIEAADVAIGAAPAPTHYVATPGSYAYDIAGSALAAARFPAAPRRRHRRRDRPRHPRHRIRPPRHRPLPAARLPVARSRRARRISPPPPRSISAAPICGAAGAFSGSTAPASCRTRSATSA